jgi:hypothetical protein
MSFFAWFASFAVPRQLSVPGSPFPLRPAASTAVVFSVVSVLSVVQAAFFRPWRDSWCFLAQVPSHEWLGYALSPAGLGGSGNEEFLPEFRFLHNIQTSRNVFLWISSRQQRWPRPETALNNKWHKSHEYNGISMIPHHSTIPVFQPRRLYERNQLARTGGTNAGTFVRNKPNRRGSRIGANPFAGKALCRIYPSQPSRKTKPIGSRLSVVG